MSGLRSIVYVSTAVRQLSDAELEGLLVKARALNLQTHTTGVLLYCDGSFMQCFEALEADAELTYRRIRESRHHTGLIELLDEPVAERSFADWQMGFARTTRSELLALSSARWQRQVDSLVRTQDATGLQLLARFWERVQR